MLWWRRSTMHHHFFRSSGHNGRKHKHLALFACCRPFWPYGSQTCLAGGWWWRRHSRQGHRKLKVQYDVAVVRGGDGGRFFFFFGFDKDDNVLLQERYIGWGKKKWPSGTRYNALYPSYNEKICTDWAVSHQGQNNLIVVNVSPEWAFSNAHPLSFPPICILPFFLNRHTISSD